MLIGCGGSPEAPTPSPSKPAAPADPVGVFFLTPLNGAEVTSPFHVQFGIAGMAVEAAGEVKKDSGHHHLIINGGPIGEGTAVPADETHIHYGQGQPDATLDLEPGEYTLTMQFANGAHLSYGKPLSAEISITVVAP